MCDRSVDDLGPPKERVRLHADYEALLSEDLDVLFVCLPNDLAAEATIAGLERGLHVFCEKPPGRTLTDIANVIEVERQRPAQRQAILDERGGAPSEAKPEDSLG